MSSKVYLHNDSYEYNIVFPFTTTSLIFKIKIIVVKSENFIPILLRYNQRNG
jgi:hypothetical protein